MATATVQHSVSLSFGSSDGDKLQNYVSSGTAAVEPRHVQTTLNFYRDPGDGSAPHPTYIDKPETYDRPFVSIPVTVQDLAGHEDDYSLDDNGFQFHRHTATEKAFVDDDAIKTSYYAETEQLLKDVYVSPSLAMPLFLMFILTCLPTQHGSLTGFYL